MREHTRGTCTKQSAVSRWEEGDEGTKTLTVNCIPSFLLSPLASFPSLALPSPLTRFLHPYLFLSRSIVFLPWVSFYVIPLRIPLSHPSLPPGYFPSCLSLTRSLYPLTHSSHRTSLSYAPFSFIPFPRVTLVFLYLSPSMSPRPSYLFLSLI